MKRFRTALLCLAVWLPLLLGCGGDKENKGSNRDKDKPKPMSGHQ